MSWYSQKQTAPWTSKHLLACNSKRARVVTFVRLLSRFCTEYIKGMNDGRRKRDMQRNLAKAIIDVMHALHELGFVHCDPKLENIVLMWPEDKYFDYKVRLIDLDSCCRIGESWPSAPDGALKFTVTCVAPEVRCITSAMSTGLNQLLLESNAGGRPVSGPCGQFVGWPGFSGPGLLQRRSHGCRGLQQPPSLRG